MNTLKKIVQLLVFAVPACGPPELPICNPGVEPPCRLACDDGNKNGDETDVDCGGHCPGCAAGRTCASSIDCESRVCVNKTCVEATCSDGVLNGRETDKDCGRNAVRDGGAAPDAAPCSRCMEGMACVAGDDCQSGLCAMMTCTPSLCMDGRKDGQETDVDCGGAFCPPCAAGKFCFDGPDCVSAICINNTCK